MSELRVPTVALAAEVLLGDGETLLGRIFVPATALRHAGATRPEEWMNESADFFPFLPDDAQAPVILNKRRILVMSVPAWSDAGDLPEEAASPERRVRIELQGRSLQGAIVIDMPQNQSRVLDYLNRPERFLTLRDGDRHHFIQKRLITRVQEIHEE